MRSLLTDALLHLRISKRVLKSLPLVGFAGLTFIFELDNFVGEDIVNARNNYTSGEKWDFWGGISTLFYAHIPSLGFRWQIWLGVFQLLICTIGLALILEKDVSKRNRIIPKMVITAFSLIFAAQMTRDGLMFSFLILGFGLLGEESFENLMNKRIISGLATISLAMSFRPWLSIAIIPLIFVHQRNRRIGTKKVFTLIILLTWLPLLLELSAKEGLKLNESFPQQQVMIMDIAASYCYTNNPTTGKKARIALETFSSNPEFSSFACQIFRSDTWVSLTQKGNESPRRFISDFKLIRPDELLKYKDLESKWIQLIISDPVTYIQNRIMFLGKIVVGSDSRNISMLSAKSIPGALKGAYRAPYDLAVSLHLFSIISVFAYLFAIPIRRFLKGLNPAVMLDNLTLAILLSTGLWALTSSVAFIGSNGRYTYSITLLSLVLYIRYHNSLGIERE